MNQLYIVTGASRGIGAHLVREILREPDAVVLGISRKASSEARVQSVLADLATPEGRRAAMQAVEAKLLERPWAKAVLLNNAGMVEPVASIERLDPEELERNIGLNVTAVIALMHAFLVGSKSIPVRRVINISSGAAKRAYYGWAAYCGAKSAVDAASNIAALEAEQDGSGVVVTSLAPGMVDTDMQALLRGVDEALFPHSTQFRKVKADGGLKRPEDVAEKILRLERAGKMPAGVAALGEL